MMNSKTQISSMVQRARSLRIETAALLTAAQTIFGRPVHSPEELCIPEDWKTHYDEQVQEKLSRIRQSKGVA